MMRVRFGVVAIFALAVSVYCLERVKAGAHITSADDTESSLVHLPIVIKGMEVGNLSTPMRVTIMPTLETPTVPTPTVILARGTAIPTATPLTAPLEREDKAYANCVDVYETDSGDDGVPEYSVRSEFDEIGRAERRYFNDGADSTMETVTEYSYWEDKFIEAVLRDLDTGVETERHTVSYNGSGNIESWNIVGADRDPLSHKYLYDASELLVRMEQDIGADDRLDKTINYEYFGDGKLRHMHEDYSGDGTVDSMMDYTWEDDRHVEIGTTLTRTGVRSIESFEYDEYSRVVSRSHFSSAAAEEPFMEFRLTYDSGDRVSRIDLLREGLLAQKTGYKYDDFGRVIEKFIESMSVGPTRTTHLIDCEVSSIAAVDSRNIWSITAAGVFQDGHIQSWSVNNVGQRSQWLQEP